MGKRGMEPRFKPSGSWVNQLSKSRPILDDDGNPLKTPPLNKEGFWKKPEFNGELRKYTDKLYGSRGKK